MGRQSISCLAQATIADALRRALAASRVALATLAERTRAGDGPRAPRLVLCIHDEIVASCERGDVEEVKALLVRAWEGAMEMTPALRVRTRVSGSFDFEGDDEEGW